MWETLGLFPDSDKFKLFMVPSAWLPFSRYVPHFLFVGSGGIAYRVPSSAALTGPGQSPPVASFSDFYCRDISRRVGWSCRGRSGREHQPSSRVVLPRMWETLGLFPDSDKFKLFMVPSALLPVSRYVPHFLFVGSGGIAYSVSSSAALTGPGQSPPVASFSDFYCRDGELADRAGNISRRVEWSCRGCGRL